MLPEKSSLIISLASKKSVEVLKAASIKKWVFFLLVTSLVISTFSHSTTSFVTSISTLQVETYLDTLASATYDCILAMLEPSTGLPHDRFDAALFDIFPQFAVVRTIPYISKADGASLLSWRHTASEYKHSGNYGLKIEYNMPNGTWGSYNIDSPDFNASQATYLQFWVKGAQGNEKFEFVLWSNCQEGFPGRPESAEITASTNWELKQISLTDFESYVDLSSLCRLSIGFNDAMHTGGTLYLDEITFVDTTGSYIPLALDEETSVTNIGLYISSVLTAVDLGLEEYINAVTKLETTLVSIESFQKWHGFPQTHNHVVSLLPSDSDTCISTVDLGYLAAGLILLRQRMPELATRADALLNSMDWDWLYDDGLDLLYGCRYPDGSASDWHYDWLYADSRLAHFIGIGTEKIPPNSWNNLNRSHEQPWCVDSTLWHYEPGWDGGGLFMAFLPAIYLDEKDSLSISARSFTLDQICYYHQITAPAWGWSATALPPYGEDYCGYGCFNDSIIVPHACILAINSIGIDTVYENLLTFETLGARRPVTDGTQTFDFGFRASLNWQTGEVASVFLVLDQSMFFLSLVNHRTDGRIRELFSQDDITCKAINLISDYPDSCNGGEVDDNDFRVMTYNSLKFSDGDSDRLQYFQTVFEAVNPDVILMQELINEAGADLLLQVLNANGQEYERVPFINGEDTDNILFFRTSVVDFSVQDTIGTELREISEYVVSINGNEVRFYSCHLKASQGSENEQKRFREVTILREHLNNLPEGTEFIIVGDMNLYDSDEPAYRKFIDDEGDNGRSEDLIGSDGVGDWHDNSDYTPFHTQSSRKEQFGGGASGGLDDRFDFIFASYGINDGLGIEYVENSYTAFGNDGNHFDISINDGENSVVPPEVAEALYYASDHLPVYADFMSFYVDSANNPPVLPALQDTSVLEDDTLVLVLYAVDIDDDSLKFTAQSDTSAVFAVVTDTVLTLIPAENWNGSTAILVVVADNDTSVNDEFILTVKPVNDAPDEFSLISPVDSTSIEFELDSLGNSLTLKWKSSEDIDGDTIVYSIILTGDLELLSFENTRDTTVGILYDSVLSIMKSNDLTILNGTWSVDARDSVDSTEADNGPFYLSIDRSKYNGLDDGILPKEYALHQNYPNPFNPLTTIRYDLPKQSHVLVVIYDILGRQIRTLVNGVQQPGFKSVIWDGKNSSGDIVSSGIYFYQILAKSNNEIFVHTKKLILLR